MTDVVGPSWPSDQQRQRRVPRSALIVVAVALLLVFAFGGVWVNYKKPWLMDDFRAGFAVGADLEVRDVDKRDDPCAQAMATTYGGEPSYAYGTPEDQSAFYLGCYRGLAGGSNDWWNVSGYLTA